ncbi:unnamed protein product [Fusarium langsethiae]|nr:unnamed protein product [Fusarium langsethiae]
MTGLRSTQPHFDKIRIEQESGGLLKDIYRWILDIDEFKSFLDLNSDRLFFWINGNGGMGKTMLICGIIDELKPSTKLGTPETSDTSLSYFFCQAAIPGLNNATAVLKGLLFTLMLQQLGLIRNFYDDEGLEIEDWDSMAMIRDVFARVLADPGLENTYLIVDALDECLVDSDVLLDIPGHLS